MSATDDLDYDAAIDIAKDEIASYIRIHLNIARAGLGDVGDEPAKAEMLDQVQHLCLAEPWLPAARIVERLRAAGLVAQPDGDGDRR